MILKYINTENKFYNIKQVAKEHFGMSDRLISKLKNKKLIFLNNEIAYINHVLSLNDIIEFNLEYPEESDNIVPIFQNLNILFEDE